MYLHTVAEGSIFLKPDPPIHYRTQKSGISTYSTVSLPVLWQCHSLWLIMQPEPVLAGFPLTRREIGGGICGVIGYDDIRGKNCCSGGGDNCLVPVSLGSETGVYFIIVIGIWDGNNCLICYPDAGAKDHVWLQWHWVCRKVQEVVLLVILIWGVVMAFHWGLKFQSEWLW